MQNLRLDLLEGAAILFNYSIGNNNMIGGHIFLNHDK